MPGPIRIHPKNPKLFEFRGKPRVLLCATEHYGSVLNRAFRFEAYLADAVLRRQTLTRLFMLFRELQSATNPYSSCKPETPDYIAPFLRTGPGKALDGEPKYDLEQWNPEFFERLHRFLSMTSDCGIIVEVVLLSNTYGENIWALNPLNPQNNINGLEEMHWPEYMSQRHQSLFGWQCAHVRKIVEETCHHDHIIYEICNEPGGGAPTGRTDNPTPEEVDQWQLALVEVVRQVEAERGTRHLIAGQQAFAWSPFYQPADETFAADFPFEVVNIHPLPNTAVRGQSYELGAFMSKQLKLRELRDYCLAAYPLRKPLNLDEDNAASQYRDPVGWTIHRKRAWVTLMCGGHYDYIDFSLVPGREAGTPESQRHIRAWLGHLSEFIHSLDLVAAKPLEGFLKQQPPHTLEVVVGVPGQDYCIYLADLREVEEIGAGHALEGKLMFDLPMGWYRTACYSPATGLYSPWHYLRGGSMIRLGVPAFEHDLVVRIMRDTGP